MRNKKNRKMSLLVLLLLAVTVGYAALSRTLKINGTANVTKQTWNVYWANVGNQQGVIPTSGPTIDADTGNPENTKVTWSIDLTSPGDYYEFTIDAVNAGSIDAMITNISNTVSPTLPYYIKYTVAYDNGATPTKNDLLAKKNNGVNTSEKYLVRVYYDPTAVTPEELNEVENDTTYTFTYEVTYGQADSNATAERFACPGPNCVYAYYVSANGTQPLYYADNGSNTRSTLTEYTDDYTTLKDSNNNQRKWFLGFILDDDDKIERGFVCGIKDAGETTERVFCLEGTTDGSKDTNNLNLLQSRSLWNYTCAPRPTYTAYLDCGDTSGFHASIGYETITSSGIFEGYYGCWILSNGAMNCGGGAGSTGGGN